MYMYNIQFMYNRNNLKVWRDKIEEIYDVIDDFKNKANS